MTLKRAITFSGEIAIVYRYGVCMCFCSDKKASTFWLKPVFLDIPQQSLYSSKTWHTVRRYLKKRQDNADDHSVRKDHLINVPLCLR
jgi:hypothetical protein